jgi:hypothetical protein
LDRTDFSIWIERAVEPLVRASAERPVALLTGARQTGKTSLARRFFPDRELVSLDRPSEAEQAERDPRAFLARHPAPVVSDAEIGRGRVEYLLLLCRAAHPFPLAGGALAVPLAELPARWL